MPKPLKIIRIPRAPSSSFNQHRLASDLVKNQVRHAHQELQRWIDKYGRVRPDQINTEQEAADYLATVTRVLHPYVAGKPRLHKGRPAKSGISLEPAKAPRGKRS